MEILYFRLASLTSLSSLPLHSPTQKVREDHVKLRIGGKKRIAGCYVHGLEVASLKRRGYHLLDYRTGKTAVRPRIAGVKRVDTHNEGGDEEEDDRPSLILIHYLDTVEASRRAAREDRIHLDEQNDHSLSDAARLRRRGGGERLPSRWSMYALSRKVC